MKFFVVVLIAGLIATAASQGNDMMNAMLLMRLLGGSNQGTSSSSTTGRAGASTQSYGLGSLFGGGRGGINPLLFMGGGDRMRDMMMCNMMPRSMRTICMARAFQ